MTTNDLINYIKQQLFEGKNKKQVTEGLIKNGWSESDISDAFILAEKTNSGLEIYYEKIRSIIKNETRIIIIFVGTGALIFILTFFVFVGLVSSSGIIGILWGSVIAFGVGNFLQIIPLIIIVSLLYYSFRLIGIKKKVRIIETPEMLQTELYKKFITKYSSIYKINIIIIILIVIMAVNHILLNK